MIGECDGGVSEYCEQQSVITNHGVSYLSTV